MANLHWYLKPKDKHENRAVFSIVKYPGCLKGFKFHPGVSISKDAKIETKGIRLISIKKGPDYEKEKILQGFKDELDSVFEEYGMPEEKILRERLNARREKITEQEYKPAEKSNSFYDLFEAIAGKYKPKTEKNYLAVRERLKNKYPNFKDFTPEKYSKWLREENPEIKTTSVNAYLSIIKEITKEAFKKRLIRVDPFEEFEMEETYAGDKAAVALTNTELKRLIEWRPVNKSLERCRDLFLIGCFTGLRSEDLRRLTMDNIVEVVVLVGGVKTVMEVIKIKTEKTGKPFSMPLPIVVKRILNKWKGFPKPMHSTQLNTEIKKVCRFAGLTETGHLDTNRSLPLCDAVQAHTARRTFVTIALYEDKIPAATVMKWTLHETESMLWTYACPRVTDSSNIQAERDKKWLNL
jgi:integrase